MMKQFNEHPHQQGVTYFEHWGFAMGISWRLFSSVIVFALHGMLPFMSIEPRLDLEATASFLEERNHFIGTAAANRHRHPALAGTRVTNSDTALPA